MRRQHDDLARFRGNYAFAAAGKENASIARLFAGRHGLRRIFVRSLPPEDRAGLLDGHEDALSSLVLDDDTWDSFVSRSDLIAEVTDLRSRTEPVYYIAVEASFTAHDKDINRATGHAKIIRSATGLEAYPVVAAVRLDPNIDSARITEDAQEYLDAASVNTALWYRLVEDELEPPDPC